MGAVRHGGGGGGVMGAVAIDFAAINRKALAIFRELVQDWAPGGKFEGDEYVVKNPLRNDQNPGSFKINVRTGYWGDFIPGGITGGDPVSCYAYLNKLNQGEAAKCVGAKVGVEVNGHQYRGAKGDSKHTWTPIPVPHNVKLPDGGRWIDGGAAFPPHYELGTPSSVIWFHDALGSVIVGECRFDTASGKQYRPLTYCRRDDGRCEWRWKDCAHPRPLFDLPALLGDVRPVLICEGARKAEVARELFPDFAATAPLFGANSPNFSDWSPVSGRNGIIWPDNDAAGAKFAGDVADLALEAGAKAVSIVEVPASWPQKWDLRDPLPAGATDETLDEMLRAALPWIAAISRPREVAATPKAARGGVSIDDFWAYMPMHNYIFSPTRTTWPAASVNSRVSPISLSNEQGNPKLNKKNEVEEIPATVWLDRHKPVEQMTWAPGLPMIVRGKLIIEGGWIDRPGVQCFNQYLAPTIVAGDLRQAGKWVELVRYVYPDDADHILDWFAHRIQRPDEKINHALVLGGKPGIGKDTLLEPVKTAVGPWNFQEVSPTQILGRFNGFLKAVILRVSEARDLGDFDRFQFYDHMKSYTAAPPDVLRIDEKHLREHSIINCCGVIITTNHKTDGIFLPVEDRRHHVAWSDVSKEDAKFQGSFWDDIWSYYAAGGLRHIAAFLAKRDLSNFNPKAPPTKTAAFWAIVDANRSPEEPELADVLDKLSNPNVVTLSKIQITATGSFKEWINDRASRRAIPHRLEKCGYVPVRNPDASDGLWKINGRRQTAYGKTAIPLCAQIQAIRELIAAHDRAAQARGNQSDR
jgi:hypothetical protein